MTRDENCGQYNVTINSNTGHAEIKHVATINLRSYNKTWYNGSHVIEFNAKQMRLLLYLKPPRTKRNAKSHLMTCPDHQLPFTKPKKYLVYGLVYEFNPPEIDTKVVDLRCDAENRILAANDLSAPFLDTPSASALLSTDVLPDTGGLLDNNTIVEELRHTNNFNGTWTDDRLLLVIQTKYPDRAFSAAELRRDCFSTHYRPVKEELLATLNRLVDCSALARVAPTDADHKQDKRTAPKFILTGVSYHNNQRINEC